MSISQVGKADFRLAEPSQDQGSAKFEAAVRASRLGLSLNGSAAGPDAKLDSLLEKLLTVLQPSGGKGQPTFRTMDRAVPQQSPGPEQVPEQPERNRVVEGGPGPVIQNPPGGQSDTAHLLQQVITLLNKQLDSGQLDPKQADLVAKLLPELEQKFVASADPRQSGTQDETQLLQQLSDVLGGTDRRGPADGPLFNEKRVTSQEPRQEPRSSDPSAGIGSAEISAMIANANGQGPEVDFASYDSSRANPS